MVRGSFRTKAAAISGASVKGGGKLRGCVFEMLCAGAGEVWKVSGLVSDKASCRWRFICRTNGTEGGGKGLITPR